MANGPMPARMLPQLGVTSTFGFDGDLPEEEIDVAIGPRISTRRRPCS